MTRYVAFLGSIKVGGNRLTMADLRAAFEAEEFANVETVVASDNVLFDFAERPTRGLEEKLGRALTDRFGMAAAVCVRDRGEVAAAIADNPFAGPRQGAGEDKVVHTHFLEAQPSAAQFEDLIATQAERGPERLAPGERSLYIDFGDGVAGGRLTGAFIERRLGARGTARDMRSLARILAKMDEAKMDKA
jgi:uncharacterized protein (DUF1697 family)